MKHAFRLVALTVLALGLLTGTASAKISIIDQDPGDRVFNIDKLFDDPWAATHSDFAFWGDYAVIGWYAGGGTTGGITVYDVSNPAAPERIRRFQCNGNQNDPILWDRNGNGAPDLLLLAVDRTMDGTGCLDSVSNQPSGRFDANPNGWEGVRVFELSDGSGDYRPGAPFDVIDQVDSQYTDCGAHTITANTKFANDPVNPRLVVYVSSYPLRPGPTCGTLLQGLPAGQEPYKNVNNPFEDPSDREVEDPLHRVIQVLNVPLNNPAGTTEIAEPTVVYPDDPDGIMDWTERGLTGLEPAAVACHDIVIHVPTQIAGGACAEQGQIWAVDPNTGIPDTEHPMAVGDDKFSSGGAGQFPGAVDFFHSVMFDNGMETVNWVDESFGSGCPTMTKWQKRPWHNGRTNMTGFMYFSDMEGDYKSRFHVGKLRPDDRDGEYCSAHMGMTVTGIEQDLLVNAWYTGGVDVIDFTDPENLKEIAYYDMARQTGSWSAYPYTGPMFSSGGGVPVYVSDGVELKAEARGMEVYRAKIPGPGAGALLDHLNPQTMED
jgi:hypothetical protein